MSVQPSTCKTATPLDAETLETPTKSEFVMTIGVTDPIVALGAEGKGSVCFYEGSRAELVGGLGNLTEPRNYRLFRGCIEGFLQRAEAEAILVAHDLHPSYLSTRLAGQLGRACLPVQHHHAHAMTVMAEHDVRGPALALVCDGAGYGSDGTIWGCELVACRGESFQRVGHQLPFPLFGGDAAAIQTWRPALALLHAAFGGEWRQHAVGGVAAGASADADWLIARHALNRPAWQTSSLGRVFDGVASLLGLCDRNDTEGQAAVALQNAAEGRSDSPYAYETTLCAEGVRMSLLPCIRALVADVQQRRATAEIAGRFHETVARMLASAARIAADRCGIQLVVLSGGCFCNDLLRERVIARLTGAGMEVLAPRRTSYGDDCLALGQAAIAAAWQMARRHGGQRVGMGG